LEKNETEAKDNVELKTADCLPDSHNEDFTGKLVIVKPSELKPEYRTSEHQLVLCTHGNGARPDAKGTSVFGKELYSGETVCFGRHQIAGVADPTKLPEWAVKKQKKVMSTPAQKPTLQEKMKSAKEKVREADAAKPDSVSKTKLIRDERE